MEKQKIITLSQHFNLSETTNAVVRNTDIARRLKDLDIENIEQMEFPDGTFNSYYDCLSILGIGTFGIVISAVDKLDGQLCAIKIIKKNRISESGMQDIRKEADILAALNHINIVQFKKVSESEDYFLIVMELVRGGSLRKLLSKRTLRKHPLIEEEVRILMKNILEAVQHLHSNNVIHRDLKLENILLDDFKNLSSVRIADFGLSVQRDLFVSDKCGTLLYMAPEQASKAAYSYV